MSDIVTYKVQKRDLSEWIKTRVQEIENAKNGETIPNGEVSGLCKYCKYQTTCSEAGNGLTDKPLSTPKFKEEKIV